MLRLLKRLYRETSYKNWQRFFLYAAGEIFLIFIGVSLAVWFNDRRENQKLEQTEIQVLEEMLVELDQDVEDMKINQEAHHLAGRGAQVLLDLYMQRALPSPDSFGLYLTTVYRNVTSLTNTASYEFLKSNGLAIISNDSLRLAISHLYGMEYSNIQKIEESHRPTQFYDAHREKILTKLDPYLYFDENKMLRPRFPKKELPLDPELVVAFIEIRGYRGFIANYYDEIFGHIENLKTQIKAHLASLHPD